MRIHTGTVTQTDRISLSHLLYELAERYADEAKLWRPQRRAELLRNARLLAEYARGVLNGAADFQRCEAYADAGATLLAQTIAQRRMLHAVLTPPEPEAGAQ